MMTVPEYVARQTIRLADGFAHFLSTTPDDRLVWHPTLPGAAPTRSMLEQVSECVSVNRLLAAVLRHGEALPMPAESIDFANGLDAQEHLVSSARELAAAISAMSEHDLAGSYIHPRGVMLGENIIMMGLRNMAYHTGQVNLIQILYGDADFHVPPNWR
jgi:hypothetical protein